LLLAEKQTEKKLTWALRCYLGGAGIAEALRNGADIVVCGRVADAAPAVGGEFKIKIETHIWK